MPKKTESIRKELNLSTIELIQIFHSPYKNPKSIESKSVLDCLQFFNREGFLSPQGQSFFEKYLTFLSEKK